MSSEHVISLIGFPGSGKSTVGVLLAKRLGANFVDTDILIQNQEGATLAEIIDQHDHAGGHPWINPQGAALAHNCPAVFNTLRQSAAAAAMAMRLSPME